MKKIFPIFLVVLFSLVLLGGFFLFSQKRKQPEVPPEPSSFFLPLEKRPFVFLTPTKDGRNFKLEVSGLDEVVSVEYELIYLSEGLPQGVVGSLDVNGQESVSHEFLLGSCSRNVCHYHTNITSGSLTLRLRGSLPVQKYVVNFNLYQATGGQQKLVLEEGDFSFEGKLTKGGFYLLCQTIGLPKMPEQEVIAGPYGIFTQEKTNVPGVVQIGLEQTLPSFKFLFWEESSWQEISSGLETDGEKVRVEVESLTTFVVTSG